MPDDIHGEQQPTEQGPQPPTRAAEHRAAPVEEGVPADAAQQKEERISDDAAQQEEVAAPAVLRSVGPAGEEVRRVAPAERRRMNRRELLKLVPVVALGAFAVPKLREPLLNGGLHLSDWASGELFGRTRLAQTFRDSDVVAFERFPYNFYDVVDPGVDLERWTLTVEGLVERPGEYKLAQIQALPKVAQNTRHVCVEGWDVIGNFGGTRASDFLRLDRRRYQRPLSRGRMCGWILRIHRHGDHAASADAVLLRDVWQAARPRTWRAAAAANADQARLQAGEVP